MAIPARMRSDPLELGVQSLTVEHAIDHLVDAAQGVVENQLELAKLELEVAVGRVLRGAAFVGVGILLLALALVAVAGAAYAGLPATWPPEQRLAILAGAFAILGTGFTIMGVRHVRTHGGD